MYEYTFQCIRWDYSNRLIFFHVRRQHLVANVHFGFQKSYLLRKKNLHREHENSSNRGEAFVCIQAVTTSTLLQLQSKSKSNTNAHFQHLTVKASYSYKTVPCCSLISGFTLLSTNNFPTYYIALLFYLPNIGCHFPLDCLSN
jgi:hypothetical protein